MCVYIYIYIYTERERERERERVKERGTVGAVGLPLLSCDPLKSLYESAACRMFASGIYTSGILTQGVEPGACTLRVLTAGGGADSCV